MRMTSFNGTSLYVSRLCLGSLNFGTVLDQPTVNEAIKLFMDHGGNFIDTAHVYSDWIPGVKSRSEKMIGEALKNIPRENLIISTKGAHYDFQTPEISRVVPEQIVKDLNESLENLKTDYIDLYFLHRDNPDLAVSEIIDCLDEQVGSGKIRYIGCSNWSLSRVMEAMEYSRKNNKASFVVNQLMWSMAKINPNSIPSDYVLMDDETMNYSINTGMGIMCFSSQAKGYFTRRWSGEKFGKDILSVYDNEENNALYQKIRQCGSTTEVTQYCLRYFENQPVNAVPIISCDTIDQLKECCSAFE